MQRTQMRRAALAAVIAAAMATALSVSVSAADLVEIGDAWIRATVPGQPVAGAFMTLKSSSAVTLTGAKSPVAKSCEVHEMKHEGGVMKMRAIPSLALPAGESVALEPGGLHLMLFGTRQPLKAGSTVPVTLTFKPAKGKPFTQSVELPVRAREDAGAGDHAGHH